MVDISLNFRRIIRINGCTLTFTKEVGVRALKYSVTPTTRTKHDDEIGISTIMSALNLDNF